jgi:hypothetical protein
VTPSSAATRETRAASAGRSQTRPNFADRESGLAVLLAPTANTARSTAAPAQVAAAAEPSPEPSAPAGSAAPSGAAAAAGPAPSGGASSALALAAMSLAAALCFARLLHPPARWRPVFVVSLIERPG